MDEEFTTESEILLGPHKVHYSLDGEPQNPLIVCFHGFGSAGTYTYKRTAKDLVELGFKVLRFDWYGHGLSAGPNNVIYNEELYLEQADHLLDALQLTEPFHLIGWSMGGAMAVVYASRRPQNVKNVILIAPAGLPFSLPLIGKIALFPWAGDWLMWLVGAGRMRSNIRNDFAPEFEKWDAVIKLRQISFDIQYKSQPFFEQNMLNILRNFPLRGGIEKDYEALANHPHKVFVVWGDKDVVVPYSTTFKTCSEILKNHEIRVVKDAGHVVYLSHYHEVMLPLFKEAFL